MQPWCQAMSESAAKAILQAIEGFIQYGNGVWKLLQSVSSRHTLVCNVGLASTRLLLEKCMDAIMGLTYPLAYTCRDDDKALARATLESGFMAETFTRALLKRLHNMLPCMSPHQNSSFQQQMRMQK